MPTIRNHTSALTVKYSWRRFVVTYRLPWLSNANVSCHCMVSASEAMITWFAGVNGVDGSHATTAFCVNAPMYSLPSDAKARPSLALSFWPTVVTYWLSSALLREKSRRYLVGMLNKWSPSRGQ